MLSGMMLVGMWMFSVVGKVIVEAEILDVDDCGPSFGISNHTIKEGFGCGEISCLGGDLAREFNEVTAYSHADSVGIFLLFAVCCDDVHIGGFVSSWNVRFVDKEVCVCSGSVVLIICAHVSLEQVSYFFYHCHFPSLSLGGCNTLLVFGWGSCVRVSGHVCSWF